MRERKPLGELTVFFIHRDELKVYRRCEMNRRFIDLSNFCRCGIDGECRGDVYL